MINNDSLINKSQNSMISTSNIINDNTILEIKILNFYPSNILSYNLLISTSKTSCVLLREDERLTHVLVENENKLTFKLQQKDTSSNINNSSNSNNAIYSLATIAKGDLPLNYIILKPEIPTQRTLSFILNDYGRKYIHLPKVGMSMNRYEIKVNIQLTCIQGSLNLNIHFPRSLSMRQMKESQNKTSSINNISSGNSMNRQSSLSSINKKDINNNNNNNKRLGSNCSSTKNLSTGFTGSSNYRRKNSSSVGKNNTRRNEGNLTSSSIARTNNKGNSVKNTNNTNNNTNNTNNKNSFIILDNESTRNINDIIIKDSSNHTHDRNTSNYDLNQFNEDDKPIKVIQQNRSKLKINELNEKTNNESNSNNNFSSLISIIDSSNISTQCSISNNSRSIIKTLTSLKQNFMKTNTLQLESIKNIKSNIQSCEDNLDLLYQITTQEIEDNNRKRVNENYNDTDDNINNNDTNDNKDNNNSNNCFSSVEKLQLTISDVLNLKKSLYLEYKKENIIRNNNNRLNLLLKKEIKKLRKKDEYLSNKNKRLSKEIEKVTALRNKNTNTNSNDISVSHVSSLSSLIFNLLDFNNRFFTSEGYDYKYFKTKTDFLVKILNSMKLKDGNIYNYKFLNTQTKAFIEYIEKTYNVVFRKVDYDMKEKNDEIYTIEENVGEKDTITTRLGSSGINNFSGNNNCNMNKNNNLSIASTSNHLIPDANSNVNIGEANSNFLTNTNNINNNINNIEGIDNMEFNLRINSKDFNDLDKFEPNNIENNDNVIYNPIREVRAFRGEELQIHENKNDNNTEIKDNEDINNHEYTPDQINNNDNERINLSTNSHNQESKELLNQITYNSIGNNITNSNNKNTGNLNISNNNNSSTNTKHLNIDKVLKKFLLTNKLSLNLFTKISENNYQYNKKVLNMVLVKNEIKVKYGGKLYPLINFIKLSN